MSGTSDKDSSIGFQAPQSYRNSNRGLRAPSRSWTRPPTRGDGPDIGHPAALSARGHALAQPAGQPGSGLGTHRWPVERSNAWLLDNKRLALRYDRLGLIIQSLLQAACIFLVAPRLANEL